MPIKIFALILAAGLISADARPNAPTLNELATVWVGEAEASDLEYFRLEIDRQGIGLLAIQYAPFKPAVTYRITRTNLSKYSIEFELDPLDSMPPIYVRGQALSTQLTLEMGGSQPRWKRQAVLRPYATAMNRLEAVNGRAQNYSSTAR